MGFIANLLFGDNSNKTSYKDAATAKAYNDISSATYDKAYSGMEDYLNQNYDGGARKYKFDLMQANNDNAKNTLNSYKSTKNQVFGNGLIGSLLNPVAQTAGAIGDLGGLALSGGKVNAWDKSQDYIGDSRDWLSDLGAVGETALDIATLGTGAGAKAGAKTLGKTIAKGALTGAGYGLAGGLNEMGAEDFDAGQLALGTALGGAIGGGVSGLGYGAGKLWDKYSGYTPSKSTELIPYNGASNNGAYQDALNTLKGAGIDTTSQDTVNRGFKKWALTNHPDKGGASNVFEKVSSARDAYQNLLNQAGDTTANIATGPVINPNLTFKQRLANLATNLKNEIPNTKVGTTASRLLNTKAGKIGAGVGGGLLLARLLNNGNNQNEEALYNYYYGGQ